MRNVALILTVALMGAGAHCLQASEGFDPLSNLAKSGASEEALSAFVQKSGIAYDLTVDEIFFLSDLGYSTKTISMIMDHGKSVRSGNSPATATVANPAPAPDETKAIAQAEPVPLKVESAVEPQTVKVDTSPATDSPTAQQTAAAQQQTQQPNTADQQQAANTQESATFSTLTTTTGETLHVEATVNPTDGAPLPVVAPPEGDGTVAVFYESLQPYGTWVQIDGNWCWRPTACLTDPNWRPYCDRGHWVYTDSDWCWQSDYSWGWAPFHYGRWAQCNGFGWIWQPDTCWSPAWVSWRECDGYYGWAPVPFGARYDAGLGFRFGGKHWGVDIGFGLGYNDYNFCASNHFCDYSLRRHVLDRHDNVAIFNRTTIIQNNVTYNNNRVVMGGPRIDNVQKYSPTPIKQMRLADANIHAGDSLAHTSREDRTSGSLQLYRPTLKASAAVTPVQFAAKNQSVAGSTAHSNGNAALAPVALRTNGSVSQQSTVRNTLPAPQTNARMSDTAVRRNEPHLESTVRNTTATTKPVQHTYEVPQRTVQNIQNTQQNPVRTPVNGPARTSENTQASTVYRQTYEQPKQTYEQAPRQTYTPQTTQSSAPGNTSSNYSNSKNSNNYLNYNSNVDTSPRRGGR